MSSDHYPNVSVERTRQLDIGVEELWDHITDGMSGWMGGDVEIDVRVGGVITMQSPGAPEVWGIVEDVEPGRRLQWVWRTDDGLPTLVEIEIEGDSETSEITIRETLLEWQIIEIEPRWLDGPDIVAGTSARLAA